MSKAVLLLAVNNLKMCCTYASIKAVYETVQNNPITSSLLISEWDNWKDRYFHGINTASENGVDIDDTYLDQCDFAISIMEEAVLEYTEVTNV